LFIDIQQTINIFVPAVKENPSPNSDHKLLTVAKEKNKLLTQGLANRDKTITNLQNELKKAASDKQKAEAQLAAEQTKNQQLELLLKEERAKVAVLIKQNSEKLIAQIEIPLKK
jgi:hypothetical protein